MIGASTEEKAYSAPFVAFVALILLGSVVTRVFDPWQTFWAVSDPQYWVNPAQTLICGALVWRWRRSYPLGWPRGAAWAVGAGILSIVLWIAPQEWLGAARRNEGFDPYFFGTAGPAFWVSLGLRFARLVIVVPLVEEIFWRGFLLRYLIDADFTKVPIGAFSWTSCLVVTAGFCLEHSPSDYPAAVLTGLLFNGVAYRTKSLSSCVLAHAATNLLLGLYVLHTRQWGFW